MNKQLIDTIQEYVDSAQETHDKLLEVVVLSGSVKDFLLWQQSGQILAEIQARLAAVKWKESKEVKYGQPN